jgi:hypothetical protein
VTWQVRPIGYSDGSFTVTSCLLFTYWGSMFSSLATCEQSSHVSYIIQQHGYPPFGYDALLLRLLSTLAILHTKQLRPSHRSVHWHLNYMQPFPQCSCLSLSYVSRVGCLLHVSTALEKKRCRRTRHNQTYTTGRKVRVADRLVCRHLTVRCRPTGTVTGWI